MLSEVEVKKGDAQRRRGSGRSMLIHGEVESTRCSVKNKLERAMLIEG